MQRRSTLRNGAQSLIAIKALLYCSAVAYGADIYSEGILQMPTLAIGNAINGASRPLPIPSSFAPAPARHSRFSLPRN
jgi:hypothetical protein